MGLCLGDHHPVHSRGGYSHSPGQNATSTFVCTRSPGLAPRSPDGTLLENSLVIEVVKDAGYDGMSQVQDERRGEDERTACSGIGVAS